jgi:hypothetical protein
MTSEFIIGLQEREQFMFFVDVLGEPLVDTGTDRAIGTRGERLRRSARR